MRTDFVNPILKNLLTFFVMYKKYTYLSQLAENRLEIPNIRYVRENEKNLKANIMMINQAF